MKSTIAKIIVSILLAAGISNAQDITNTLAPNGSFKIKDNSTDYLSLSQATGNLSLFKNMELGGLTNSTPSIGVITKNGERFIHNYMAPGTSGLNTFIGTNSGNFTLGGSLSHEGSYNTAVGVMTLTSLTTGYANCAFGLATMRFNTTGYYNSAFGNGALNINSSGYNNSAFGISAMSFNTTGFENSAFGSRALRSNSTGIQNTAVGHKSLYSNVSGFQNTAVGDSALYNNSGNYNTAIGYNAGSNVTTGANLTLIGIDANPSSPTAIDQITLGNQFVSSLRCNVQTITSLSDVRDKKNIQDLTLGLDFITKLKPRQFNWDRREWYEGNISDGSKIQETPTAGFIAQEFDETQKSENAEWLNLVLKDNPDKWEATYGNLLPVMVKALQELKAEKDNEISELKIQYEKLEIKNANLEERLEKYEEMQTMLVKELEQIKSNQQNFKVQLVNSENNNQ
jgi:trimeric autotransporter adhesin